MCVFIVMFLYVVIGYGLSRLMNQVKTQFGKDCQENFLTIAFWPIIMVMVAWNKDLTVKPEHEAPKLHEDLSNYTL